jgi:hypothetical protein
MKVRWQVTRTVATSSSIRFLAASLPLVAKQEGSIGRGVERYPLYARRRPKRWQNYDIQTETSRPMSSSTEKDYEGGYKKPQAKYSVIFIVFAC